MRNENFVSEVLLLLLLLLLSLVLYYYYYYYYYHYIHIHIHYFCFYKMFLKNLIVYQKIFKICHKWSV